MKLSKFVLELFPIRFNQQKQPQPRFIKLPPVLKSQGLRLCLENVEGKGKGKGKESSKKFSSPI